MEKRTKTLVAGLVIAVIAFSGLAGALAWLSLPEESLFGDLYFNDSGEAHGGFEMAAEWNVELHVRGGIGVLTVTPDPNQLGNDALKKWSFSITGFLKTPELVVMTLDGHLLQVPFVQNDTVWNIYDGMYILRTPDLDPTIFLGFLSSYYAELRFGLWWPRPSPLQMSWRSRVSTCLAAKAPLSAGHGGPAPGTA